MEPLKSTMTPQLILASSSRYRAKLLDTIQIPYRAISPAYEEAPLAGESPQERSIRHADAKAKSVATSANDLITPDTIIIGSDQVAFSGSTMLGKPLTRQAAVDQLTATSGKWLAYVTAVCLYRDQEKIWQGQERFDIKFRPLTARRINWYVDLDQPLDCAGSIKAEGLGLCLIEQMRGRDVNTLYGLPIIMLLDALDDLGIAFESLLGETL
jgi:septum formation protein